MIKTITATNKEDFDELVNEEIRKINTNPKLAMVPASTVNIIPFGDSVNGYQFLYTAVLYYIEKKVLQ